MSGAPASARVGDRYRVVISVEEADGILGMDFELDHDPAIVSIPQVQPIGLAAAYHLASRALGGRTFVALYGVRPLEGSGALLAVTVEARAATRRPPFVVRAQANEGRIALRIGGAAWERTGHGPGRP